MYGIQSNTSMKEVTYKYRGEEVDAHKHTNTMKWLLVVVIFLWFSSMEATRMGATSQSFVVLNEDVADGRDIPSPRLPKPAPNPIRGYLLSQSIPPPPNLS